MAIGHPSYLQYNQNILMKMCNDTLPISPGNILIWHDVELTCVNYNSFSGSKTLELIAIPDKKSLSVNVYKRMTKLMLLA